MSVLSARSRHWMLTQFGYCLGVVAANSDLLDYRAMLARAQKRQRVPMFPTRAFLDIEMVTQEPFRFRWERREWARREGVPS